MFQSTPSRRGRHFTRVADFLGESFQSTPSRRGRPFLALRRRSTSLFQSTPSRRGRHDRVDPRERFHDVSIHALAKRATFLVKRSWLHDLFQSTPSRRGRRCHAASRVSVRGFNPRPREEGDCAPTLSFAWRARFQSTPSRRGRQEADEHSYDTVTFQSTPSRRGRHGGRSTTLRGTGCFNPRPREEGDFTRKQS